MDLALDTGLVSAPFLSFLRAQARGPDAYFEETELAVVAHTGIPGMARAALKRTPEGDELANLIGRAGRKNLLWIVLPEADHPDLGQQMMVHGLRVARRSPTLVKQPAAGPSPGKTVRVGNNRDLERWRSVASHAFPFGDTHAGPAREVLRAMADLDHCRFYLVFQDGVAVCCGLAVVEGGTAGLYWVATDPRHRRQGHATVLVRDIEADLAGGGVRSISLQASAEGLGVYEKRGFRPAGTLLAWEQNPDSPADYPFGGEGHRL